jgi:hypothetical protein
MRNAYTVVTAVLPIVILPDAKFVNHSLAYADSYFLGHPMQTGSQPTCDCSSLKYLYGYIKELTQIL